MFCRDSISESKVIYLHKQTILCDTIIGKYEKSLESRDKTIEFLEVQNQKLNKKVLSNKRGKKYYYSIIILVIFGYIVK